MTPRAEAQRAAAPFVELAVADLGRGPCWGLVCRYYREVLGIELPGYDERFTDARESAEVASLMAEVAAGPAWREVSASEARAGDVVHLWKRDPGRPSHVGVLVSPGWMLHAEDSGVSLGRLWHPEWARRVVAYYRHVRASSGPLSSATSSA